MPNTTEIAEIYEPGEITTSERIEIIDECIRKKYLTRLGEMSIVPTGEINELEEDIISNIRLFKITEMVYQRGELATEKFTTVFNTLSIYNASTFIVINSDGIKNDYYIGVRNNEDTNIEQSHSMVTLGDMLKNTLIGNFPGIKISNMDRHRVSELANRILEQNNVAAVSVVGTGKSEKENSNEQFVQGLEKLVLAMQGRSYTGIIIAQSQSPQTIEMMRKDYQDIYTKISPYQKEQISKNTSESTSRAKSFAEMNGIQKTAVISGAVASIAGGSLSMINPVVGLVGSQIAGQMNGFLNIIAPNEQISKSESYTSSTTVENKAVTDMLKLIDEKLKMIDDFDSYGMWNVAGYFISDDMSTSEIAASNYRSLMNGEKSGREVSAINSWKNRKNNSLEFNNLITYLSRFVHPKFVYGGNVVVDASVAVSGRDLGIHLGLPRATVPGLPVIQHSEFGKEVNSYSLFTKEIKKSPEDRMTLGRVFDLGQITNKVVELDNKSLNMHTFVTGSTGSGKSNVVYQILSELHQDNIPFLVIEPAKGEYKDVFGNWSDVNVFSTNPKVAPLININPFKFPESIHVLEHIDGLVEIFGVCWPMYDAMPAFFKDAILKSYEYVGWDLGSSTFEGKNVEYPDFEILAEELARLINESDYASDIKSNYRGALLTRVNSLTVGLNKFIFTNDQTSYQKIFDENCILDISRVKSTETKALIMGLMVYILNEYRVDRKTGNNNGLKHITVLEEAHNLLKNTSQGGGSELIGKSVEMLTNTIAEIRTYGEGFVIVDQSPSSVDIAAIKNTNTKIILRTPEANDRDAIGRSIGLTPDQVNEIAKLPGGVAVVYQNDWITPVLTLVNKADVKETLYKPKNITIIRTARNARTKLIKVILCPWLSNKSIFKKKELLESLNVVQLSRENRKKINKIINDYIDYSGNLIYKENEIPELKEVLFDVLNITDKNIKELNSADEIKNYVKNKLEKMSEQNINEICNILTWKKGE